MTRPQDVPDDETKLWRYIDFTKFVALLSSRALFFCRLDCLGDPFEGAKGSKVLEQRYDTFYMDYLRKLCKNLPEGLPEHNPADLTEERLEEMARGGLSSLRKAGEHMRKTSFVNCWHEAPHESEAMWCLYAGWKTSVDGAPGGIVVQTTAKKLRTALHTDYRVDVGRVRYIDYSTTLVGINEANWHKAKSLEHEKEVRAITHLHDRGEARGVNIPIDLATLIIQARVAPLSPEWFSTLVSDVVKVYGLAFPVDRSALEAQPFY